MTEPNQDPGREALQFDPGSVAWTAAEVIARPPAALSRLALYGVGLGLLLAFAYAATVEVPEEIVARGELALDPPIRNAQALSPGRIARVAVQAGEEVREGQLLAELDRAIPTLISERIGQLVDLGRLGRDRRQTSEQERLARELRRHRSELARAELLVPVEAVFEALRASGAEPGASDDAAGERSLSASVEALAQARAQNDRLYRIRSPISGRVLRIRTPPGQVVESAGIVASVAPRGASLRARALVPEAASSALREGARVRLLLDERRSGQGGIPGRVVRLAPAPEGADGRLLFARLEDRPPPSSGASDPLRPGAAFSIKVVLRRRSLLRTILEPRPRGR